MSSKNKNNEIIKDKKLSSIIEVKEKDNKLIYVLIIVILILSSLLIYNVFFTKKETCNSCCSAPTIEVEVEPKYQLINYEGFRFKMPLEWDFVSNDNKYSIADKDEKLFINLDKDDSSFDSFISSEYQDLFLENIQTSDNIKIDLAKKEDNYYLYEGTFNNYNYLIVAVGNSQKTILVEAQFIDKISYDKLKENVIKFAIDNNQENNN